MPPREQWGLLIREAEQLADDLFEIAVLSLEYSHKEDFNKSCDALEHAIKRVERRRALGQ